MTQQAKPTPVVQKTEIQVAIIKENSQKSRRIIIIQRISTSNFLFFSLTLLVSSLIFSSTFLFKKKEINKI